MRVIRLLSVVLALIAGPAMLLSCASDKGGDTIEFPYLLKIAPGNVLFVHGHEFRDQVSFTWEEGDSLRIEGMPVLPARPVPPKEFSEEQLAEMYGTVPFIVRRVQGGATWREAANEYHQERRRIKTKLINLYNAVLDSTRSEVLARAAVLDSADHPLIAAEPAPDIRGGSMRVNWEGLVGEVVRLKKDSASSKLPVHTQDTEAEMVRYTGSVARYLDGRFGAPWVVVIDRRGRKGLSGGDAREALDQVENAKLGRDTGGPLDQFCIDEIMRVEGGCDNSNTEISR